MPDWPKAITARLLAPSTSAARRLVLYIERKEHGKPGQFTARTRERRTSSGKRSSPRLRLSRRCGRPRRTQEAFEPLQHEERLPKPIHSPCAASWRFWTYVQQRGFQEREMRTGAHVEL